jgi:hypothetical protein
MLLDKSYSEFILCFSFETLTLIVYSYFITMYSLQYVHYKYIILYMIFVKDNSYKNILSKYRIKSFSLY